MGRLIQVTVGTVSGLPLSTSVSDGLGVADSAAWEVSFVRELSESVGLTDSVVAQLSGSGGLPLTIPFTL